MAQVFTAMDARSGYTGLMRARWRVLAGMAAVTLAGWAYLIHLARAMQQPDMAGAWMPPVAGESWSGSDFLIAFMMWAVMMVAMMTPTVVPMTLIVDTVNQERRRRGREWVSSAWFVAAYLTAWTLYSALLALLQWPLHVAGWMTPMMETHSAWLAGGVLIAAGLYQWTPWKDACLSHCRTPLGLVMSRWREGRVGAFAMGFGHGWFCIGCCWALMIVMFAVGLMNMMWAALITLFVLAEKVWPGSPRPMRLLSGMLLLGWGAWLWGGAIHF